MATFRQLRTGVRLFPGGRAAARYGSPDGGRYELRPTFQSHSNPSLVFRGQLDNDTAMNLEHLGLNHPDAVAAAAWYEQNLGMKIARKFGPPGNGHFLADAQGKMMLEFYHNALAPVPDFRAMNPMSFHVAFQVDDVAAARDRLIKSGATAQGDVNTNDDGDQLAMVRDPWGLSVQLVKRTKAMI